MTSPVERKKEIERLTLLCHLDRARVRLKYERARQRPPSSLIPPVFGDALDIAKLVPGACGRWARRLSFATGVLKRFM